LQTPGGVEVIIAALQGSLPIVEADKLVSVAD
jgi:hypothetical protein